MSKFLSVLVAGLIAGSLSAGAIAAESAKPQHSSTAVTSKVEANKSVTSKADLKKDTGIKASVKKLFSANEKKHT